MKLFEKGLSVINSCITPKHIEVAEKYIKRVSIINQDVAMALNYNLKLKQKQLWN